jgi:hypothetical protein
MSQLVSQLDAILDDFRARMEDDPIFGAMLRGTASREHLAGVYGEVWHCIQETPRALSAAGQTLRKYAENPDRYPEEEFQRYRTPFFRALIAEFAEHTEEETGHDDWMKDDLGKLGVPAVDVERSQPGPAMTAYLAVLRHTARSRTPIGVWGQAYILEGLTHAFWAPAANAMVADGRIPRIADAVYCIRGHEVADLGHRKEAQRRLASLRDERDQEAVLQNARATVHTWGGLTLDILDRERR